MFVVVFDGFFSRSFGWSLVLAGELPVWICPFSCRRLVGGSWGFRGTVERYILVKSYVGGCSVPLGWVLWREDGLSRY